MIFDHERIKERKKIGACRSKAAEWIIWKGNSGVEWNAIPKESGPRVPIKRDSKISLRDTFPEKPSFLKGKTVLKTPAEKITEKNLLYCFGLSTDSREKRTSSGRISKTPLIKGKKVTGKFWPPGTGGYLSKNTKHWNIERTTQATSR